MRKQVATLDFSGQTIICGIDTHKKDWKVCVRDDEFEHRTFSVPPTGKVLAEYLKRTYPSATYKCVYEAGFAGFVPYRELQEQGIECLVVHPADVPTADKERKHKSDIVDCRKLARSLCKGEIAGIYVPSLKNVEDRNLVRCRSQLVIDQTRYKNRIKSMLFSHGIIIPADCNKGSSWSSRFISWLKKLHFENPSVRQSLDLLLEGYGQARNQILQATKMLRKMASESYYQPSVSLLRSIPGIGLINALILITEIENIHRFKSVDRLCGYCGLVPDVYGSGDKEYIKGITSRGNANIRNAIIESSWQIIRKEPALLMAYKKYCNRMVPNKAIIKIGRKLVARIRYVLVHKTPYQIGKT